MAIIAIYFNSKYISRYEKLQADKVCIDLCVNNRISKIDIFVIQRIKICFLEKMTRFNKRMHRDLRFATKNSSTQIFV